MAQCAFAHISFKDHNVPDIVLMEYRQASVDISQPEDVLALVHPVSGNCRRYVLGD